MICMPDNERFNHWSNMSLHCGYLLEASQTPIGSGGRRYLVGYWRAQCVFYITVTVAVNKGGP